ncbi:MAG: hydrogenase nickel incorporation protein HypB [Planctomycetes bacterium]|nr:hydrogenase nickel incorporation protein HypB [Planctomycetota bacterium]
MTEIPVGKDLLDPNDRAAAALRARLAERGVWMLNLMSGAGAGKTTLLVRTLERLKRRFRVGAVAGDLETSRDAERLATAGVPVAQINTHGACHLEADQVERALREIGGFDLEAVVVENVGNLVCPAEFDVGETERAMILSVAEGHDKPAKYPLMFTESRALLLNKIDLLPHVDFDEEAALRDVRALNPSVEVFRTSARTGEGMEAWYRWVEDRILARRRGA